MDYESVILSQNIVFQTVEKSRFNYDYTYDASRSKTRKAHFLLMFEKLDILCPDGEEKHVNEVKKWLDKAKQNGYPKWLILLLHY